MDECATVLTRHHVVLGELLERDAGVLVVTVAGGPQTRERRCGDVVRATTRAHRWWSFETEDSEPDWPAWCTAFVSRVPFTPEALDPLLRLVIDDVEHGVILAAADFGWLYRPPMTAGPTSSCPAPQARDDIYARVTSSGCRTCGAVCDPLRLAPGTSTFSRTGAFSLPGDRRDDFEFHQLPGPSETRDAAERARHLMKAERLMNHVPRSDERRLATWWLPGRGVRTASPRLAPAFARCGLRGGHALLRLKLDVAWTDDRPAGI